MTPLLSQSRGDSAHSSPRLPQFPGPLSGFHVGVPPAAPSRPAFPGHLQLSPGLCPPLLGSPRALDRELFKGKEWGCRPVTGARSRALHPQKATRPPPCPSPRQSPRAAHPSLLPWLFLSTSLRLDTGAPAGGLGLGGTEEGGPSLPPSRGRGGRTSWKGADLTSPLRGAPGRGQTPRDAGLNNVRGVRGQREGPT